MASLLERAEALLKSATTVTTVAAPVVATIEKSVDASTPAAQTVTTLSPIDKVIDLGKQVASDVTEGKLTVANVIDDVSDALNLAADVAPAIPGIAIASSIVGTVDKLLFERGTTHGKFEDNADIADSIQAIMQGSPNWNTLSAVQRQALNNISGKISRALSGDANHVDNWSDIAGYAQLVVNNLNSNTQAAS